MTRTMYSVPDYSTRILPGVNFFQCSRFMYDPARVSKVRCDVCGETGREFCN